MIRWLYPGLRVKRWLLLSLIGLFLILAGLLSVFGRNVLYKLGELIGQLNHNLVFNAAVVLGLLLLSSGLIIFLYGQKKFITSLFKSVKPDTEKKLAEMVFKASVLKEGPKIVVIGGGTGLSTILRGLKLYTTNLTAIVTVADDGGSSGRLRDELGILPPGDIRNCLLAMAEAEPLLQKLFQYRFQDSKELAGHSFGNLFIAAMTKTTGSFTTAIDQMSKVLAVSGKVLPATNQSCSLQFELENKEIINGESNIVNNESKIENIELKPNQASAHPQALNAIREADIIILGPGSLFTSIIPNLLVANIPQYIKQSSALKLYICNVMTQNSETQGFKASHHLAEILKYGGPVFDYVLVNNKAISEKQKLKYQQEKAQPVEIDLMSLKKMGVKVLMDDFVDENNFVRHDSQKLAAVIMDLFEVLNKGPDFKAKLFAKYKGKIK